MYILPRTLNSLDSTHEKVLITGDFNVHEVEKCLDTFLYQHELKSLNKKISCQEAKKPLLY